MEALGFSRFSCMSTVVRKRRSSTSRRPWSDPQLDPYYRNPSPHSSAPFLDNRIKLSSEGNDVRAFKKFDGLYGNVGNNKQVLNESDIKHYNEGVLALFALAPTNNWKGSSIGKYDLVRKSACQVDSVGKSGNDCTPHVSTKNKLTVKIKLGGGMRTIHEKSDLPGKNSSSKDSWSVDPSQDQQKLMYMDSSDDNCSLRENSNGLRGDGRKDISQSNFFCDPKEDLHGKVNIKGESPSSLTVQKCKMIPRGQILDAALEDSDKDYEISYLRRIKTSKAATVRTPEYGDDKEDGAESWKTCKGSRRGATYHSDAFYGLSSRSAKESRKKSRSDRESSDANHVRQEEHGSADVSHSRRKKQKKGPVNTSPDDRLEPLATRQRALQSGQHCVGSSLIEFPNGLPYASSKTRTERLSEEEKLAKKAEAAQKRKMQMEKAAREAEAITVRKILGLNSDKKKAEKQGSRADKVKSANSETLLSNKVRLVMGPKGTVVMFPKDAVILLHGRNVLDHHVQSRINTEILGQIFHSAVYSATELSKEISFRNYMLMLLASAILAFVGADAFLICCSPMPGCTAKNLYTVSMFGSEETHIS